MPRNSFPVSNRRIDEPILVTDIQPICEADAVNASGHAGSLPPTIRERAPWRPMGACVASLGVPVGIGALHPVLGEALTVIEIVVVLTIIGTALFGNLVLSERAFRLLRWLGNRPEPPRTSQTSVSGTTASAMTGSPPTA
jgi:hypothetical protein